MLNPEWKDSAQSIVDWALDYLEHGTQGSVCPSVEPGDITKQLPNSPPLKSEPLAAVFEDFKSIIVPGMVHWNDPRFFGYFPATNSLPSVLGELAATTLGANAMSWATSPAATELEFKTTEWLADMLGLSWPGVLQDTASTSVFVALLAARERHYPINQNGYYGQKPLVVYASEQAHSSVQKAARMAAIGDAYFRHIPTHSDLSVDVEAFKKLIDQDIEARLQPLFAVGTVGSTSTTAVDDIQAMANVCQPYSIWLHVDAALAGAAAILPEMKWLMNGVEQADSFTFNPHKWLFTNAYCSAFFVKNPKWVKKALSMEAKYLETKADGSVENLRDWQVQLGRPFRSLKLWFVIRAFGVEGLQQLIRGHLKMAQWFAQEVKTCPDLVLWESPKLNTVCFRLSSDTATRKFHDDINATGKTFLSHTEFNDFYWIRVSFGQTNSSLDSARQLWELVQETIIKL